MAAEEEEVALGNLSFLKWTLLFGGEETPEEVDGVETIELTLATSVWPLSPAIR